MDIATIQVILWVSLQLFEFLTIRSLHYSDNKGENTEDFLSTPTRIVEDPAVITIFERLIDHKRSKGCGKARNTDGFRKCVMARTSVDETWKTVSWPYR